MTEEKKRDYFRIGAVVKAHGIRGEMKVFPTTDDPKRFSLLKGKDVRFVTRHGEQRSVLIQGVKYFKNLVILKLDGIETPEEAERLRGGEFFVSREEALPLEEGEYYISDLIGLSVETEAGEAFGTLSDVLQTGANDVYEVDSIAHGKVYLPVIPDCVKQVDLEGGKVVVHIMKGLI